MSVTCSERDPLIERASVSALSSLTKRAVSKYGLDLKSPTQSLSQPLGPLEMSSRARHGILAGIWLAQFLSALNLTLVPTMLPEISSEFRKSNEASWVGTSYLLATCTFTPLYGRLSNVMGRNGANQSAVLFALFGILSCGLSNSMQMLVISRFISGMGGGGIFTTSSIITSDMYTMRSRGFVQSIGGIFYGLGMGLGGPVGGLITDWLGWRWAFLIQIPLFVLSWVLTTYNLTYVIPGTGRGTKEVLKRIDYGGSFSLLGAVGLLLVFLSVRFNEGLEWSERTVWMSLLGSIFFAILFIVIEIYVAVEPVLPPYLLTQKVPVLVGFSNALVAVCNLSVTYYFPTWFQTVMLSSASTAGLHLLPNSICISSGSFFAGWTMKRYGCYKSLNMIFGILPFCAAVLMTQMKETSNSAHLWLTIMPLGFGNAIVLQTMFIALVSHLPESQMAVGTGFAQLLRGLGQVGGLALASAVFQSRLNTELHKSFPNGSEELIMKIRHSVRLVGSLPPDTQRLARDAYAASLKSVFILAASASILAYLARLPIPDKRLEDSVPRTNSLDSEDSSSDMGPHVEEIRDDEDKIKKDSKSRSKTKSKKKAASNNLDKAASTAPPPSELPPNESPPKKRQKMNNRDDVEDVPERVPTLKLAGTFDLYAMELSFLNTVYAPEDNDGSFFSEELYLTLLEYQAKNDRTAKITIPDAYSQGANGTFRSNALCDPMEDLPFHIGITDIQECDGTELKMSLDYGRPKEDWVGKGLQAALELDDPYGCSGHGTFRMRPLWKKTTPSGVVMELFEGIFSFDVIYGSLYRRKGHGDGIECPDIPFWGIRAEEK
ncbi:unnamed protein product [Cyclocybe aegerita]|uniref:Major facilitator superfamily (MFS) profile domain-containing protein n=1 Tax=Cyclocybe aegerita TaxID=1973307 RepID=A0A8S0VQS5_CYCAE|nr:unnamed protein product [Cyclocybe aegerita]